MTLAIQALPRSVDNLAVAFNGMRPGSVAPGSVAPGSVVPWRASAGPRQRRRQRCKECGSCLAKLAAGVSRPPCESWAAVPGLERDLPRTPAKREPAGDESDALDMAEEFNIDDLLASRVPGEKKAKSKKRRKLPPDLSSKDHRDGHGDPGHDGDGHGADEDGHGGPDGGCGAPVEVGNHF